MQQDSSNKTNVIFTAFNKLDKLPKIIIKYGLRVFILLFALGTFLVVINHTRSYFDPRFEFIATNIIKNSFTILAEGIIGGLLIDYIFKQK